MKRKVEYILFAAALIVPALAYGQAASSTSSNAHVASSSQGTTIIPVPGVPETSSSAPSSAQQASSTEDINQLLIQLKSIDKTNGSGSAAAAASGPSSTAGNSTAVSEKSSGPASTEASSSSVSASESASGAGYEPAPASTTIIPAVTVVWKTPIPATSEVYYSIIPPETETADSEKALDMSATTEHAVRIENLLSDTTYYLLLVSHTPAGQLVYAERKTIRL